MVDKNKESGLKKPAPSAQPIEKAEGYKTLYVNSTRLAISAWDIRTTFGQIVERKPDEYINEDQVTVFMAPGQAKAFLRALDSTIQQYENTYGEIHIPPLADKTARN